MKKRKQESIRIFLASQSPRRRYLLKKLGLPFRVVPSNAKERIRAAVTPSRNAMLNARAKVCGARNVGRMGCVVGADTFIYFRGRVIGKPKNLSDAKRILARLSGRVHYVYTGLALFHLSSGKIRLSYAKSKVRLKKLEERTIAAYIKKWKPLDKAGAYAIQQDGHRIIRSVEGSLSNVIGFPVELFLKELSRSIKENA